MAGAGALFFLTSGAHAVESMSVEIGYGDERTAVARFAIEDRWRVRENVLHDWHLAGYWEFSFGIWDNADESTADVAATPVFRFQRDSIYLEGAIGVHLVTSHISAHRTFSSAFQFGTHIGAGHRFGPGRRYDLGLRVQHISNGGLREPNPGINFVSLRFQYDLE
jgi:hypothetical protein